MPKFIHSDQTGFIKGRYIGQNVRLLEDILEYTNIKKNIPGIVLFIDFEKAFDTIEWPFIQNVYLIVLILVRLLDNGSPYYTVM